MIAKTIADCKPGQAICGVCKGYGSYQKYDSGYMPLIRCETCAGTGIVNPLPPE